MATSSLFASCTPAIRTNVDTTGLVSLTSAQVPTPTELDSIFMNSTAYRIMEALFQWKHTTNMLTLKEYDLFDLLTDMAVDVSGKLPPPESLGTGQLRIAPYILSRREEPINNQYFSVTAGKRCDADGSENAAGIYWLVSVTSPNNIPMDDSGSDTSDWFHPGEYVFCTTQSSGGTIGQTMWKVVVFISSGDKLVLQPAMGQSQTGANAYAGAFGATSRGTFDWGVTNHYMEPPVTGMLFRGLNNVTSYESWCEQAPGLLSDNFDPFWFGSVQDTYKATEAYREWNKLVVANNPLYEKYYNLPEVEYRKQLAKDFKARMAWQVMYGEQVNSNQTMGNFRSLPTVSYTYPDSSTEVMSYRANPIGIFSQHFQKGRVINMQGKQFNLQAFANLLYTLTRYRKQIGMPNWNIVEVMMPKTYYPGWNRAFLDYYKYMSNDMLQMFQDVNKVQNTAPLGFIYRDYPMVYPPDVTVRVVFHDFWDDQLARATAQGIPNAGREIWIMPWKYNRVGIVNTERKVREVGDIEDLAKTATSETYQCTIRGRKTYIELTNITYTVMCTAPMAGMIFTGVGAEAPEARNIGAEDYATSCSTIL